MLKKIQSIYVIVFTQNIHIEIRIILEYTPQLCSNRSIVQCQNIYFSQHIINIGSYYLHGIRYIIYIKDIYFI